MQIMNFWAITKQLVFFFPNKYATSAVNFNHPRSEVIILLSRVCYYAIMNGNAEINNQAHRRNNVPCSLLSKAGVSAGRREGAPRALSAPILSQSCWLQPFRPPWQQISELVTKLAAHWTKRRKNALLETGEKKGTSHKDPYLIKHVVETGSVFTSTLLKTVCALPKSHSWLPYDPTGKKEFVVPCNHQNLKEPCRMAAYMTT